MELSMWQKKQCALLYYLSSDAYLRELGDKVDALLKLAADTAELAVHQERDRFMRDPRWGERDTVANWKEHAWPFLLQLRSATDQALAARGDDVYGTPDFNFFSRGFQEFSMNWATPDEEAAILAALKEVGTMCATLDRLTTRDGKSRAFDDVGFARCWHQYAGRIQRLPRLRIRDDLTAASFERPPATGVYIVLDDPYASPQFAFSGHLSGYLLHSKTLGYLGHQALRHVGRRDLWLDAEKMHSFATSPEFARDFDKALGSQPGRQEHAAIGAVAAKAFHTRACKWTYVEMTDGEPEDYDDLTDADVPDPIISLKSTLLRRFWELTYPPTGK